MVANLSVNPMRIAQVESSWCAGVGACEAQHKPSIAELHSAAAEAGCLANGAQPLQESADCISLEMLHVGRQRSIEYLIGCCSARMCIDDLTVSPSTRCHEALVSAPKANGSPGRSCEVERQRQAQRGRGSFEAGLRLDTTADGLRQSRGASTVVILSRWSPDGARRVDFRDPGGLVQLQVAGHVCDLPRGWSRASRAAKLRARAAIRNVRFIQQELGCLGLIQDTMPMPMLQEVVAEALAWDVQDQRPVDSVRSGEALH
mmetsp:Transcript_5502/g.15912  ORF Transcript_5502/g.15912 Transcript_5502/m.15912 type:complete len:260 (+) Transcript_5502:533-1312(+)